NSLYWNKTSGNCYKDGYNTYVTCDFSTIGLNEKAKSMIEKYTWSTGSNGTINLFEENNEQGNIKKIYEYERSNNTGKICASESWCNDTVNRTTTWEGYVGLMYPSDYGYATGGEVRESCLSRKKLYSDNNEDCINENWIGQFGGFKWSLSPISYASYVFTVDSFGSVISQNETSLSYSFVFPTLFLIPSITISGDGTPSDPYTLSLE
ncbi:MAG: hypothetical protein IJ743_00675, partial [Bacilli bacterium]|nr:hypothetical protein [Bacilli bacterium]